MDFQTLVINVRENTSRLTAIGKVLEDYEFQVVHAVTPSTLPSEFISNMTPVAVAVWSSHLKCLEIASTNKVPTLILEDDSELDISQQEIGWICSQMQKHKIAFVQIGFLYLNPVDRCSIAIRNLYDQVVRHGFSAAMLSKFGFQEVARAKEQAWRKPIPNNLVLNDIRYGAHCYLVDPEFARKMCQLNNPPFLSADDFYVSLSKMKSFRMTRLRWSRANQSGSPSSFNFRFGIES